MSETEDIRDHQIVERSKALFDESVRDLDASTRSKLAQARARAIEAAQRSNRVWQIPSWLVPAGAAAAAGIVFALIWQLPGIGTGEGSARLDQASMIGDLEFLMEEQALDLFEDLEFYAWLLEQPELLESSESADGSG